MTKVLQEEDKIYIINDINNIDDSALNLDKELEINNILPNNQISCKNTKVIISFLKNNTDIDLEKTIENYFDKKHSLSELENPHKWVPYEVGFGLFKLLKETMGDLNPRSLIEVGRHASQYQSLGKALDLVSKLATVKLTYQESPKYGRMLNNGEIIQSKSITPLGKGQYRYIAIDKFATYVKPIQIIDQHYWTLGIYQGIPGMKGLPFGEGKMDYSLYDIETLLTREYEFLNVNNFKINLEKINSDLKRKRLFIEGKEYAHEVLLLKETLKSKNNSNKNQHKIYKPEPIEFEKFTNKEIQELLNINQATKGMLVTDPFTKNGQLVIDKNEIYNMPYTRFSIDFKDRSLLRTVSGALFNYTLFSKKAIEEEVKATKIEAMRANIEAQKAKNNEKIAIDERNKSEQKSNVFRSYTRPSLVDRVDKGEDPRQDMARSVNMSVLFSDIRSFTALSEDMNPEDLIKFLNSYFERMTVGIQNGEIDKIIGDCLMIGFLNRKDEMLSPYDAVQTAINMKKELILYNRERLSHTKHNFKIMNGIGIDFGSLVQGNIGSPEKLDHTLIGDIVNSASRLEGLTKYYNAGIIISESVASKVEGFQIRPLDKIKVKGKKQPIKIYEVFDYEPERVQTIKQKIQPILAEAFNYYKEGNFKKALKIYQNINNKLPKHKHKENTCIDPTLDYYINRAKTFIQKADKDPSFKERWTGVYGFNSK